MLSGKATIVLLIIRLIKKAWFKWLNIFQNRNLLDRNWKLDYIYLIIQ